MQELIRYSQLQQRDDSDLNRYQHALETLLRAEKEAVVMIEEVTTAMADLAASGTLSKEDGVSSSAAPITVDKGKEKQREVSPERTTPDSEDLPGGDEQGKKRGALQNRLRECRLSLHQAKFLQGDIHHILGASQSEDEAYGAAEKLRHELLKSKFWCSFSLNFLTSITPRHRGRCETCYGATYTGSN